MCIASHVHRDEIEEHADREKGLDLKVVAMSQHCWAQAIDSAESRVVVVLCLTSYMSMVLFPFSKRTRDASRSPPSSFTCDLWGMMSGSGAGSSLLHKLS